MFRGNPRWKFLWALAWCVAAATASAADWLPITPEELAMTSEPNAPTASAIYLYRQVDRDDDLHFQTVYNRIKILTEEGREYGDVQIAYIRRLESIRYIEARTIRPDGTIVNFDGAVFSKPIIQGREGGLLAKTFTLPDVQVGSIIEYRYRHSLGYVYNSQWILSQPLFTKRAKFSLNPSRFFTVGYSWPAGLPPGTSPPKNERGSVYLEAHNVPAFAVEDYMPPEDYLKYRVDFVYMSDDNKEKDPVAYWKKFGKQRFKGFADYVNEPRDMQKAVAQIVTEGDAPEVKLRKIYARVQQLRNTSYEREKSAAEEKREALKEARDVSDVWKLGYGNSTEINWLFIALARAAGFEADAVLVSARNTFFFNEKLMNPYQVNSNCVVVKLAGKDVYLDPGTAFAPYGLLRWSETGVRGLRLDKNGGTWVTTPLSAPTDSRITRKANLRLTESGTLEGKVTVTYVGHEALWRRVSERNEDDADRKEFLEDDINYDIPGAINIELTNEPAWSSSDSNLIAEYDVKVPGWASAAGQRMLLTVGLFTSRQKDTFKHAMRIHPLYFRFANTSEDEITIDLPENWQVGSVPQAHSTDLKVIAYKSSVEAKGKSLLIKREMVMNMLILEQKYYQQLRDFFQTMRTHDEQQVVIERAKAPPRK